MPEYEPLLDAVKTQKYETVTSPSNLSSPLDEEEFSERHEPTRSIAYLIILTLGLGGLSIAWSVELSYLSPFLLSLGLSKAVLALVWIAGPLSGTLVQPYVGMKSDNCRIPWGRRRPFIVGGAIATMVSLMFLAWCVEIVSAVMGMFGKDQDSSATVFAIQVFAVMFVYILDFSINVIQASLRAFIVDCAPSHQQSDANAWASRVTGGANILGYLWGYVYLPDYLPFLGDTQFKILAAITCFAMTLTMCISIFSIGERDPRGWGEPSKGGVGLLGFFLTLYRSVRRLPKQISRICQVQIAAWVGWFPFLFYITTYIAELYADPIFTANPHLTESEINAVLEEGTRQGTFALFIFSFATFFSSIALPFIVAPAYDPSTYQEPKATPLTPASTTTPRFHEGEQTMSGDYFFHKPAATLRNKALHARLWRRIKQRRVVVKWLTLRRAWMFSHLAFTVLMLATFFVRDVQAATILVGLVGIPWALTNWAPYALIAAEISRRDAIRRGRLTPPPTADGRRLAHEQPYPVNVPEISERGGQGRSAHDEEHGAADQAGVVLGIHNVAIAAPQVFATLMSSVIFQALQKPRGLPGDDSVVWVLRFGGLAAILAALATKRVGEGSDEDERKRARAHNR